MTHKSCSTCKLEKPISEFSRNCKFPTGYDYYCKPCKREYNNRPAIRAKKVAYWKTYHKRPEVKHRMHERYHASPEAKEAAWERNLLRRYGMTRAGYYQLLAEQGGGCAICHVEFNESGAKLSVDHCHETGRIRGILCSRCNLGIGYLDHDAKVLNSAIGYLSHKRHRKLTPSAADRTIPLFPDLTDG